MMKKIKRDGWFRTRGYPHLDRPLSFERASDIARSPTRVAKHSFLPLLGYSEVKRQFRTDNSDRTIPRRQRPKIIKNKTRDIKYAAHADAAIFSYYAMILQDRYEAWLAENSLANSVIGYRPGIGSNVDMAAEAFAEIAARGTVTALCFDISNFFPSIPHAELKRGLCEVLGCSDLPPDWYKVYRACTKFSWVEIVELSKLFNFNPDEAPSPLVDDLPAAMNTIRSSKSLNVNTKSVEIPQGTPISAVFANVAMAFFDRDIENWASKRGATYRRYSDDILLLVEPELEKEAADLVSSRALHPTLNLNINPDKTEISRFNIIGGNQSVDRPITYLGFTFDGANVTLRSRTLSRYYRRMTYAVRGSIRGAGRAGQPSTKAFKRGLYRELTHLGSANFYTYAARAHPKFHASIIKRQLRRHFKILIRKLSNRGR